MQSAFGTGTLRRSLPALTAAQPLAGVACGVGFPGDRLQTGPWALAGEAAGLVAGLVAIVAGIVLLSRHPALPSGAAGAREKVPRAQPARSGPGPAVDGGWTTGPAVKYVLGQ